jgi:hypothetical protein
MRRRAMTVFALGLLTAVACASCAGQGSGNSVPRDVTAKGLLAAYAKTLQAGPSHFMATVDSSQLGLTTFVGVEDLAHNAVAFVDDNEGAPGAMIGIGTDFYMCTPHGGKVITFAPGYCDAATRWLYAPLDKNFTQAKWLTRQLTGNGLAGWTPIEATLRSLGRVSIRGVAVTGYAFNLDTEAANAALRSAPGQFSDTDAVAHVWIDNAGLVREFKADVLVAAPGLGSPPPIHHGDYLGIPSVPNPSLAAQQAAMSSSVPIADSRLEVPAAGVDQLTQSTTVQIWDVGTAPSIAAPPPEAVYTPTPNPFSSPSTNPVT